MTNLPSAYEPVSQLNPFGGRRSLAYDQYAELSKQTRVAQANLAVNAVQAGLMAQMRDSLASITNVMDEVRRQQADALAIQQELLQREQLQSYLEEFVFQTEKLADEYSKQATEIPPSSRYFVLVGITKTIEQEGIATALIRGRDNKAAFEAVVERVRSLISSLKQEPEVKEAVEWAKVQRQKMVEDRNRQVNQLKQQIVAEEAFLKTLQSRRQTIDAAEFVKGRMAAAWNTLPNQQAVRILIAVFAIMCLNIFVLAGVAIYAIWIRFVEYPNAERKQNEQIDAEIETTQEKLASLKADLANLEAGQA